MLHGHYNILHANSSWSQSVRDSDIIWLRRIFIANNEVCVCPYCVLWCLNDTDVYIMQVILITLIGIVIENLTFEVLLITEVISFREIFHVVYLRSCPKSYLSTFSGLLGVIYTFL